MPIIIFKVPSPLVYLLDAIFGAINIHLTKIKKKYLEYSVPFFHLLVSNYQYKFDIDVASKAFKRLCGDFHNVARLNRNSKIFKNVSKKVVVRLFTFLSFFTTKYRLNRFATPYRDNQADVGVVFFV